MAWLCLACKNNNVIKLSRCWLGTKIAFAGDYTYVHMIRHNKAYRLTYHNWHHTRNEVYRIPTFIFFWIPIFGIGISISQFFNSKIQEIFFEQNLRNQKRERNSASNGGPRNRNQKSEFPTKDGDSSSWRYRYCFDDIQHNWGSLKYDLNDKTLHWLIEWWLQCLKRDQWQQRSGRGVASPAWDIQIDWLLCN